MSAPGGWLLALLATGMPSGSLNDAPARLPPTNDAIVVPPTLDDATIVTLERGQCFWKCPDYVVKVYGSGRVEFEGRRHVCAKGRHSTRTEPFAVRNLVARLVAGDYLEMVWAQGPVTTDAPVVTTALQYSGQRRVIRHHHGDSNSPRVLDEWEEEIDAVARTARWLPEREDHHLVCRRADGRVEKLGEVSRP